jgi:aminoglycoside 3-N-acetyltransferase
MESTVTRSRIAAALEALGLRPGDCVLVHSSLSSFGHVRGGADTVIGAFLDAVGETGTLVMPTLCQKDKDRRFETWNMRTSPSDVGRITEHFRLRPHVLRSDHPTHSVAAKGPLAREITRGHATARPRTGPWGHTAFGIGSPWETLYEVGARIVLVGVDFQVNTMVHFIEHRIVERALARMPTGRQASARADLKQWQKKGTWPYFDRLALQAEIDRRGALARATCGNATLLSVSAKRMVDVGIELMEADPAAWFAPDFTAWLAGAGTAAADLP